jgi:hypothetical protein
VKGNKTSHRSKATTREAAAMAIDSRSIKHCNNRQHQRNQSKQTNSKQPRRNEEQQDKLLVESNNMTSGFNGGRLVKH